MRQLISAEVSRLVHRRFAHVMLLVIVGIMVCVALGFVATSEPPTDAERREAAREAVLAQARYDSIRTFCLDVERGVADPLGQRFPANCDFGPRPRTEDFLNFEFVFMREFEPLIMLAGISVCLFAFLVGASFVGAEWTSGGLTNLLLWRPHRASVLGAKLGVLLGGVLVVSIAYVAAWIGVFLLVGWSQGAVGSTTSGEVTSFALLVVRVLLLALTTAAIGFALASLGRHTAMALGALIGYLVVYELGITIVAEMIGETWPWYLRLTSFVAAWLIKEVQFSSGYSCDVSGCGYFNEYTITWEHAGTALGGLTALLVVLAFWALRRRDLS